MVSMSVGCLYEMLSDELALHMSCTFVICLTCHIACYSLLPMLVEYVNKHVAHVTTWSLGHRLYAHTCNIGSLWRVFELSLGSVKHGVTVAYYCTDRCVSNKSCSLAIHQR